MDNCYQYLLSVAQKIIRECADNKTIDKYFSLKQKIMVKCNYQTENSHLALSTLNKENSKCSILKTSAIEERIRKESRCKTRQSVSKSKLKESQKLSRARIQSYSSKVTESSNATSQRSQQAGYHALLHTATLIKNAQSCPNILKTISFCPNPFNQKINSALQMIAASLSSIYCILTLKENKKQKQNLKQDSQNDQIIQDNKWLMSKLGIFLEENTTLRRMIGHRVY